MLVEYFVNGGPFMWPILLSLVFGLAFAGERFYSLIMSSINAQKFFEDVNNTLDNEGVEATLELCEKQTAQLLKFSTLDFLEFIVELKK